MEEENKSSDSSHEIDFCTFAMFIIDEIHYLPPTPPVKNVIGGAGSYAALGARLFSPPPRSSSVGWIVDMGSDFPPEVLEQLKQWQTSCVLRKDPNRLTTRGWNGYLAETENRAFKYTTPKLRIDTESLPNHLLMSNSFHMVCSPSRCISLVTSLNAARRKINRQAPKPVIVWEPVPDLCTPDELINLTHALAHVTICSPNHLELGSLLGSSGVLPSGSVDKAFVEQACEQLLESMPISSYGLIIRSGKDGCFICKPRTSIRNSLKSNTKSTSSNSSTIKQKKPRSTPKNAAGGLSMTSPDSIDFEALFAGKNWERSFGGDEEGNGKENVTETKYIEGVEKWIPAYHTDGGEKVVDPTGGGNAFLGAMAVALARGESIEEATLWGTVAASFVIEQAGMPRLDEYGGGEEKWNGKGVSERLRALRERVKAGN